MVILHHIFLQVFKRIRVFIKTKKPVFKSPMEFLSSDLNIYHPHDNILMALMQQ